MSTPKQRRMMDYGTETQWLRFLRKYMLAFVAEPERVIEMARVEFEKSTKTICPERS